MPEQGVPSAHLRNVGGAVLGWVVMAVCVTGLMIGLFALLGPDRVFRPGGLEPTPAWLIASIAIGLAAAVAGGTVCAKVASDRRGVLMLIALVVVLGVADALAQRPPPEVTAPEVVGFLEALGSARPPAWISWLSPLLGAVGTLVGAGIAGSQGDGR
ncbi:MAG: hypothetical protein OXG58_05820 [Gemmatimonadetes bacterium]|nr:hypothetical protein [Gemmatimonadota bacterium]MCY3944439.1 hypothetical protein [Gemmatimonadota bacterium]